MAAHAPLAIPTPTGVSPGLLTFARDLLTLAKPRITLFVVMTAAGGLWLGRSFAEPGAVTGARAALTLGGLALVVGGANALNMVVERDIDRYMVRTRTRPLPAGRMHARTALAFGLALSAASVPLLVLGSNVLTAFLAVLANLLYVLAYTPMKQRSHHALEVGAVPGAMPPLLGWTAATGRLDAAALVLFGILYLWQLPHFLAIATFRRHDYARAGLFVMPNVRPMDVVKQHVVSTTLALVLVSLLLVPLGVASGFYLAGASLAGCGFLAVALRGFSARADEARWPRALFATSLVYLVVLIGVLAADVVLRA